MALTIAYPDPVDQALIEETAGFRNLRTGFVYPLRNEIPVFLPAGTVEGPKAAIKNCTSPSRRSTTLYAPLCLVKERPRLHSSQSLSGPSGAP